MASSSEPQPHFPIGVEFLNYIHEFGAVCEQATLAFNASSGKRHPEAVENLGTVLSHLYRAACCQWGCRGGDHILEWQVGRAVNQAMSSYRLSLLGHYDESLMITRGIGEIANLLHLFHHDSGAQEVWRTATRQTRKKQFGPAAVRRRLEKLGKPVPVDEERYRLLCEVGTHPTPNIAPTHFTGAGRPVLGLILQPAGAYVAITELAFATAMVAVPAASLLELEGEPRSVLGQGALDMVRGLGAFSITSYEDLLAKAADGAEQAD